MNNIIKGKLLTLEGIDGAGKSSHVQHLSKLLTDRGIKHIVTREPGGTELGEKIRALCLHESMHLETEALLMFASRRELLDKVIEPALARGEFVISDRFTDSSFAFQGGGRGLARAKLETLENWVHPNLQPDVTFLFDLDTGIAKQRISSERVLDRFEKEREDFHKNVRNEYLRRAEEFPNRFKIIDSTRSIPEIRADISTIMEAFLMNYENSVAPVKRALHP